jgi:signal transduction histidine kinase
VQLNPYAILCLDNNPISIDQISNEMKQFTTVFDIHCVDNIEEADAALEFIQEQGQQVALVLASHHEQLDGVNFLIQLDKAQHAKDARKVLISCGTDIQSILTAVNQGRIDYCLTKPLHNHLLAKTIKNELTNYIIDLDNDSLLLYSSTLDQQRILRKHIDNKMRTYRQGFITDYHELSDLQLAENVIVALYAFFEQTDDTQACRTYSANHMLTVEGQENHFLWFITNGEVALYKQDENGRKHEVVRHSKGNLVGGMSFVTGEPSFSSAITLTQTHVIKLDRDVFARVMHSNSDLLPLFTNLLLRHFNRRLQRSIDTKLELQKTLDSLQEAQEQLIDREKMAVLGQLIAGVAHELNNPVAAILRATETLAERLNFIMESNHDDHSCYSSQGIKILNQAINTPPQSTSEERAHIKMLENDIGEHLIAKKLVKLGLMDDNQLITLARQDRDLAINQIRELEHYAITGASLRSILVCTKRIADMVKSLKSYARTDNASLTRCDITQGIEDTLVIFDNRLKSHTVVKEYAALPVIDCQINALQQVWTNLIANALDALPEQGGRLLVETKQLTKNDIPCICVKIQDNGSGIPEAVKEKIFALNFTTKKEGNFGLGIGLSVAQQIIHQHSGWIDVESTPNQSTTMSVYLPINQNRLV